MGMKKKIVKSLPLVERLKADLIAGRYRPGEWLKQIDIESTYAANRFEVRVALSELTGSQFIEHLPNRGYRVANPTTRDREDLYELRTILETAAARKAAARTTEEDVAAFEKLVEEFDQTAEVGSRDDLLAVNLRLHDRLYQITGNKLLASTINGLRGRKVPGGSGNWESLSGIRMSSADHREMLEMLRRKDPDGLAQVVYRHLNRWRENAPPG